MKSDPIAPTPRTDAAVCKTVHTPNVWGFKEHDRVEQYVSADFARQLERALAACRSDVWIPCDERMPEDGDTVLVYVPNGEFLKTRIDTWRMQHESPVSFSSATVETGLMWDEHEWEEVTHWKPLTSPLESSGVVAVPREPTEAMIKNAPPAEAMPEYPELVCTAAYYREAVLRQDYDALRTYAQSLSADVARLKDLQCHHGWRGTVPEDGRRITTRCPECGCQSLFIGAGGHLTCARVPYNNSDGCPNPSVSDAVDKLKQRAERSESALAAAEKLLSDGMTLLREEASKDDPMEPFAYDKRWEDWAIATDAALGAEWQGER